MKSSLIKLLTGAKGRLVSVITGALVGVVTKLLTRNNATLDPEIENLVSTIASLAVMWAIDSLVLKLQSDGVRKIQDALPPSVVSDGVPGEKTVAAVEKAVSEAESNTKTTP